jgi:hypothetical protein
VGDKLDQIHIKCHDCKRNATYDISLLVASQSEWGQKQGMGRARIPDLTPQEVAALPPVWHSGRTD